MMEESNIQNAPEERKPAEPRPAVRTEVIAGITTFLTMSYIVVVNPAILATPGTNMPFDGVLAATVLLSFSMTLLMGLSALSMGLVVLEHGPWVN